MSTMTVAQALKLAEQCKSQGKLAEAEGIYRQILASAPAHAAALNGLGIVMGESNRLTEARGFFQQAVKADSEYADAWANLSLCCERLENFNPAVDARRRTIELKPDLADYWHRLGVCLAKRGDVKEGLDALRRAQELDPPSDGIRHDLILVLGKDNDLDAAMKLAFPPPPQKPPGAMTIKIVADSLKKVGRFDDATEVWRRALELDPSSGEARGQWAMCLITVGDFERGWREYEARWQCDTFEGNIRLDPQRQWGLPPTGHPDVAGKTILLYSEQGIGDMIQCARYASIFAQRGARVIVQSPWSLKLLLEKCAGVRLAYAKDEALPKYDWHVPVMSLPFAFGTTLQTIPADVPYLQADPGRCKSWLARVQAAERPGSRLRVGLAWAGNPKHKNDSNRSLDPALLSGLASVEGIAFFSLQKSKENKKAESSPPGLGLIDLTQSMHDFAETAAFIEQLDLVICADTAVAHLAGALAKPVWTLIPFVPDFRWLLQGSQTAWYPTMRLFRQKEYGNWQSALDDVVAALREFTRR
jgi:tetratricopeptide (TPR) repeat protein